MSVVLGLLAALGLLGAFDTVYYHEYRAHLPALGKLAVPELRLHAARDFIYGVLFSTLPWIAWHGAWVAVLGILLLAEIVITLSDFVVEDSVRRPLGGVFKGERVTHAVMGIVYGAMLAYLIPQMLDWSRAPMSFASHSASVQPGLKWLLTLMAVGVSASGVRDLYAVLGGRRCGWPWPATRLSSDD